MIKNKLNNSKNIGLITKMYSVVMVILNKIYKCLSMYHNSKEQSTVSLEIARGQVNFMESRRLTEKNDIRSGKGDRPLSTFFLALFRFVEI